MEPRIVVNFGSNDWATLAAEVIGLAVGGTWLLYEEGRMSAKVDLMQTRSDRYREAVVGRVYALVAWIPSRIGVYLRRAVVGWGAAEVGSGLLLDTGIRITGWAKIALGSNVSMMRFGALHAHDGSLRIGNNVSINTNCCIAPANGGRVEIGDNVLIAQNVVIRAADHRHDDIDRPIISQGHVGGEIFIGEGAWICANAVITRDVRIGANAIVGAGSVVTEDVAPFAIVGGVPARLIRSRLAADTVSK